MERKIVDLVVVTLECLFVSLHIVAVLFLILARIFKTTSYRKFVDFKESVNRLNFCSFVFLVLASTKQYIAADLKHVFLTAKNVSENKYKPVNNLKLHHVFCIGVLWYI